MTLQPLSYGLPADQTTDLDDSSKKKKADRFAKYKTIAQRLEVLYGVGDNPQLRRKFYQRVQRCAIEHGPDCYQVVLNCVSCAVSADSPARYFCRAVSAELKALAYWEIPVDF